METGLTAFFCFCFVFVKRTVCLPNRKEGIKFVHFFKTGK